MHSRQRTSAVKLRKRWIAAAAVIAIVAYVMTPHTLERMFLYFPTRELEANPSGVGLAFQDLNMLTEDRVKLHGWFVPSTHARTTLLIFHGNAGNISHRLPWIEILHDLPAHVLIVDYRGYGKSEGTPFEEGLYLDAWAAYAWWARERATLGEKLVLIGESLGGAVAIDLATRTMPAGLIVQSTFTSAREMARTVFPLGFLQPLARVRYDSASKILQVKCPKLVIHGTADEIVPLRMGEDIFRLASDPKWFYPVQGASHNDLVWEAGPEYSVRLRSFLDAIENPNATSSKK